MTEPAAARSFWWREGLMLFGFVLLVVASVVTVVVPELREAPEEGTAAEVAPESVPEGP